MLSYCLYLTFGQWSHVMADYILAVDHVVLISNCVGVLSRTLLYLCFQLRYYTQIVQGLSWLWPYGSWIYNYLCNQCLSSVMLWVRISIRAMCTTLCDKVCQTLATGRWFSPGPLVSSTNKTDRYDIAKLLLKMVSDIITLTKSFSVLHTDCGWLYSVLNSHIVQIY